MINDQSQQSCDLNITAWGNLLASLKAKKMKTKKHPTLKKIKLGKSLHVDTEDTALWATRKSQKIKIEK